ncbi:hypothetical protein [Heyndrickxia vini]|uniref:Uncharacterized protein n=1 Tax=Heyndrickxia vini TaxID=1476025 RepID=A0ABX7DYN2_9BACI|nr:hypothetical protein [Heyndrickxia vini]QQZ08598.1 hypothetical protein I5776_16365 [Heyndrickxia vini]
MAKFIDDFLGAIYDFIKLIIKCAAYCLLGMIIVAIPMYLFVVVVGLFK